ncbi:MAG: VOC family protein [Mycobacteriaceae bacterium]
MYLENLGFDAVDPARLGTFWREAIGGRTLTDTEELVELRLSVPDGPELDLCFARVPERPTEDVRLHLDLDGGADPAGTVQRLLRLGARPLDLGQGEIGRGAAPRTVLADPEGNAFCVMGEDRSRVGTGPISAVPIDSADPAADAEFWAWLTGWSPGLGAALRHPSSRGMYLEFSPERAPHPTLPATAKNRLHLDVRLEQGDDLVDVLAGVVARGGHELNPDWGELPWTVCADPSGNVFCLLPARAPEGDPGTVTDAVR